MTQEEAKDLALSILVIVAALLVADVIWLHCKCAKQCERIAALERRVELHVNPPAGPSVGELAKEAIDKTADAVRRGYRSVKGTLTEPPKERLR